MSIAKFPCVRTLEGFEFEAQPSIDPKLVRELATSRWVANGELASAIRAVRWPNALAPYSIFNRVSPAARASAASFLAFSATTTLRSSCMPFMATDNARWCSAFFSEACATPSWAEA
ncbi:ATP-binding protein [Pelomonas sp. Root1217]|uniref:ATP-binding protein n=1 Tax=Pelomonas sp. Root1217 TaxID=1736430 RepID=UPI0026F4275E|nr:ATP-binding protein [Pelomonas sp. Root1217]